MHIQTETKVKITKSFKDIKDGECFNYGGKLLFKVSSHRGVNAAGLEDGESYLLESSSMVEPKKCKVVVE